MLQYILNIKKELEKKNMDLKGFTLIELLVVIAIIAILAAILFPVFAQAREKARQTTCLSNTKQISLAFNMYSEDYDEMLPSIGLNNYKVAVIEAADGKINVNPVLICQGYIKNYGIGRCPSDQSKWKDAVIQGTTTKAGNSYCYNAGMINMLDIPNVTVSLVSLVDIAKPSEFMMMVDGSTTGTCLAHNPDAATLRHLGGFNVGFADGHSKFYKGQNDANGNVVKRPWPNDVNTGITNFGDYPIRVYADCADANVGDPNTCRSCVILSVVDSLTK